MLWSSFIKGQHESLYLRNLDASYDISLHISLRCTNPYDPYVYIHMTVQRHQRRLAILVFQFMEQTTNLYLKEEVSIQEHVMVLRGLNTDSLD